VEHSDRTTYDARSELDRLHPPLRLDRRGFVMTSLGAGFAAAVLPVQAKTMITTDTQGLTAGEVKIPTRDGEMPAYRAQPAGLSCRWCWWCRKSLACTNTSRT
jgi:carboxymethylenebutenolidase